MRVSAGRPDAVRQAIGVTLTALSVMGSAEAGTFEPRIGAAITYIDNFFESTTGNERDADWALELTPGLSAAGEGVRWTGALEYTYQMLKYDKNSESDQTYHQLEANGQWRAIADWLTIEALAGADQVLVEPTGEANYDNLLGTENIANSYSYTVAPTLNHQFGSVVLYGQFAYSRVDYEDDENLLTIDYNEAQEIGTSLGSADPTRRFTWLAGYDSDRTDFGNALEEYQFDLARLELGLGLSPDWRLLVEGGMETDPTVFPNDGGLDSEWWRAGFRWTPDARNMLEARVGERFFGDTYFVSFSRTARLLTLRASYDEGPMTDAQDAANRNVTFGEIEPDPVTPIVDRVTEEPYISRELEGEARLTMQRTTLALRVYGEEREYFNATAAVDDIDRTQGVELEFERSLGPRLQMLLNLQHEESELREGVRFEDREYRAELVRQLGTNASASLQVVHVERKQLNRYDVNLATLRFDYTF